ncbi:MAG: efflux RND transporter permease subunit [Lachnospiraceae bacterium]|nr:efflux RND transporter permease subunit [Lachnospiraceae bacterium]
MLSRYSVKRPYTVIVGVVLVIILGYVSFTSMQTDLLPDMTLPYAVVYTVYPGASPEEVETIVTKPVEQSMATISNIEEINSISSENISTVILQFSQNANMDAVTIEMRESLDQIEGYWDDSVGSPIIMKLNPDMLPVMVAAMEAGDMTQSELTTLVNNEILPELEGIEGVASVSANGTIEEQVQVMLRQDKLDAVNEKVIAALDKKFEEAEQEIQDAQAELDEGKDKLESGQGQLVDQTSQAESQLSSGTSQMITGQVQIDQKLAEVESGLQALDTSESELLEKEKELLAGEAALKQLPVQKEALAAQKTQIETGIQQLEAAPGQIALLEAQIVRLDQEIKILEGQIAALGGTVETEAPGNSQTEAPGNNQTGAPDNSQTGTGGSVSGRSAESGLQSEDAGAFGASLQENGTVKTQSSEDEIMAADVSDQQDEILDENIPASEPGQGTSAPVVGQDDFVLNIDEIIQDAGGLSKDELEQLVQSSDLVSLQSQLQAKQAEKAAYEKTKADALAALAAIGVNTSGDYYAMVSSMDSVKSELITRKAQVDDGIAELQKNIDAMPEQMVALEQGKTAIAEGKVQISSGRTQLQAAKKQLEDAKAKIASGQSTVSEATAQLNAAKISATIEMAAGKAELSAGQKQLDAALEQIKDQKESAYKQADVTQIITKDMIKGILAAQNFSMPAGYVTEDGVDFLVRIGNKLTDTEGLEDLMLLNLHMDDVDPICLSDVADVTVIDDSDTIYASVNGHPGVVFTMQKQSGYSTGDVSDRIKSRFAKLEESNENVHIVKLMDQGIYIDLVVDSVLDNILSGAVLAIVILLIFMKSFRPTLVIACSIPISIVTALVLMYFSNISLNIISLSGLALGVGMLVDNSIVVIENIYRLRSLGVPAKKAAVEGANQVAGSIAASTMTTICVFLPIVFTEGITRQLFVDMGLTIAFSLLASLAVALTVVPMMGAGLLRKTTEKKSRVMNLIQSGYGVLLRGSLKLKFLVLLLALGLLGYSGYLALSKGTAFMPEMDSTQVSVTVQTKEGSTLQETAALSDEVIERILSIQDVTDVGAMNGSGGMSLMGGGGSSDTEQVSMYVLLDENKTISNKELEKEILDRTEDLDCEVNVETSTMDMSALGGSGISVQIQGRDLDELKRMAGEVADIVKTVEGTAEVSDGIDEKTLELRLVVDKNAAMSYQLTTAQVFQMLQAKLAEASSATTLSTMSKDYSVIVVSDADETLTRDKIKKLTITGKDEENQDVDVPLSKLVEFQDTEGFSSIQRQSQNRYVTVTAQIDDDHNIGLVSADVQKALEDYDVPEGYSIKMAGEDETINEAMGEVLKMLALAVVFMYLIMVIQFQSLLSPFIIMFTIPLAFTGGLFGLYLTDNPVSVIAMIGFVMLSGIIVNNGIVLVDYINQLRREGMDKKSAIVEAGKTRLRPILMTALTTILGLLPLAAGMGMGADMIQPMAIVTVGGLVYGTLLTLFVVPCIYDIFNREKDMRENFDL